MNLGGLRPPERQLSLTKEYCRNTYYSPSSYIGRSIVCNTLIVVSKQGGVMFDSNGIRILSRLNVIQYREMDSTDSKRLSAVNIAQVKCTDALKKNCTFQYANGESESTVWPGKFRILVKPTRIQRSVYWRKKSKQVLCLPTIIKG